MKPFRTIEHTADIGIEVEGGTLKELFLNAAEGMTRLIFKKRGIKKCLVKEIEIEAVMVEELLVKWLEEILYLIEVDKLIPSGFGITEIAKKSLKAEISCVPFDPEKQKPAYSIKAVTYHNLNIVREKGMFRTRLIFDI